MNTTIKIILTSFILLVFQNLSMAQDEKESFQHSRIALIIGHAYVSNAEQVDNGKKYLSIPTWGFNYEYWFSEKIGLGWKNDLEISNYIIENSNGEKIERELPFSTSLIFLYKPIKGFGIYAGGGIELEKNENLPVFVAGISYEIEIPGNWDITPELGYELKDGTTGVIAFGLGIGKRLGK